MFIVTWLFDKIGYMPKVSVDSTWPFPATQKDYTPHDLEFPVAKVAKKTAKKTVKIPKATTRKPKTTKK
jgi:hypothetical protein